MRYRRVKKAEGIRLFKDVVFLEIPLDFLHNSGAEGLRVKRCYCEVLLRAMRFPEFPTSS